MLASSIDLYYEEMHLSCFEINSCLDVFYMFYLSSAVNSIVSAEMKKHNKDNLIPLTITEVQFVVRVRAIFVTSKYIG